MRSLELGAMFDAKNRHVPIQLLCDSAARWQIRTLSADVGSHRCHPHRRFHYGDSSARPDAAQALKPPSS